MPNFHIVSDSGAHFPHPQSAAEAGITIVPFRLLIGDRIYREGVDISNDEVFRQLTGKTQPPKLIPPSVEDYLAVFQKIGPASAGIISVHMSKEISQSWHHAKAAADQLSGQCPMLIFDSQTLSAAQAMIVRVAAEAAKTAASLDEIVQTLRAAVEHIYSVFYVENTDFLLHNGIMEPAHAILSTLLGVKPLITVEHGRLVPMEKVRTRAQAVERLVEFAIEFTNVIDGQVVQNRPGSSELTRMLHDRLAVEFPSLKLTQTVFGASLAALIGVNATGLIILEDQEDRIEEDDI
ncbi:DegV family protein [Anaerolineae bacterium CFX9]|nr:DegV family protein [Anaerolineae bacterium CFX9]